MDAIEKLKDLLNSVTHQVGTDFSKNCIKLLEEIILAEQKKARTNQSLEKLFAAPKTNLQPFVPS